MYLHADLLARAAEGRPVRAALIGAGKFGSMFLSQVPTTPGLEVAVIADLRPDAARAACRGVGWDEGRIAATAFTDDAGAAIGRDDVDVVIEATGHPRAGVAHARAAFAAGKHIVMVNVEADALVGALLAKEAASAGVVYSMAYGDQPALTAEMVDWARSCGFEVVAAGKGTKYLPEYHASTPATVWGHYGMTANEAGAAGMNAKMFNSFLDGTKSALEMAAIANACFPPCGMDELAEVLRPKAEGGALERKGQVEVVSSLHRDGSPVERDLRWGVYVVFEAPNDYAAACFRQYGMNTDASGRYSAMYKPFHLIGLELNISVLSAGLLGKPTGSTRGFRGDVVATAKRALKAGERLDGEGGETVWGKLSPAETSVAGGYLPIGLAQDVTLKNPVSLGNPVRWEDVDFAAGDAVVAARKAMEGMV
jgi:predicted homoserine dehydrogenase-like protein